MPGVETMGRDHPRRPDRDARDVPRARDGLGLDGRARGPRVPRNLLEWVFGSYFDAFEEIEATLEEIDTRAMSGDLESRDDVLEQLVAARREIGSLRRALTSHREAILALTRPELEAIASSSSAERFCELRGRLDEAVQAARDSRSPSSAPSTSSSPAPASGPTRS